METRKRLFNLFKIFSSEMKIREMIRGFEYKVYFLQLGKRIKVKQIVNSFSVDLLLSLFFTAW